MSRASWVGVAAVATVITFRASFVAGTEAAMVYGETTRLDSFDPYTVHEASGLRLADLLFDSLVELDPTGSYTPVLAKSWIVQEGGAVVDMTLRDDVSWHVEDGDGAAPRKFGADDVVATVRILTAAASDIPNRERFSVFSFVEKLGDSHIRIKYQRALADPLRPLLCKVLPAHLIGSTSTLRRDAHFTKAPIGTGPYRFIKANAQGEVLLAANDKYFRGVSQIARVVMKSYVDQTVMAQSLMYDSLDLVTYVSPRDLGEMMGDGRLNLLPYDALSFSFVGLNTQRGVLRDKRVRQALAQAVNRTEMLAAFFQGNGRAISGPFPPTSWAYNLDVKPTSFDPARARALLVAAGLTDRDGDGVLEAEGKPVTLVFAVPVAGESEMVKRVVLALQSYLEVVGVKVELRFMDWLAWKKKVLEDHDYDATIASWSFDDASNITSLFHSSSARPWGNNFVQVSNRDVDSLLTEVDASNDPDKKRAISHKLHAILADEAPYIYLWSLTHYAAHSQSLTSVRIEPFSFFKYVTSWRMETNRGQKR